MRRLMTFLAALGVLALARSAFGQYQYPQIWVPNSPYPIGPVLPSYDIITDFYTPPLADAVGGSGGGAGAMAALFLVFQVLPLLAQGCTTGPM